MEQPPGMQIGEVGVRNTGATGDAQHGSLRSHSCPLLLTTWLWAVESEQWVGGVRAKL